MATPQEVFIQDKNSGKVLQYFPNADYEVQIESQSDSASTNQKWLVTESGVAGYVYIESKVDGNVISVGDEKHDHLIVYPKKPGANLNQLWIFREPTDGTNRRFVIASAKTGYVMDVTDASTSSGTGIQVYDRTNKDNQQFSFYQWNGKHKLYRINFVTEHSRSITRVSSW